MRSAVDDPTGMMRITENAERFIELAEEIQADPDTQIAICGIIAVHGMDPSCDCKQCQELRRVATTALINGVRIGIAMERAEFPK